MSDHKLYVGVKAVAAKPQSKEGNEGYEVIYKDGYKSWSPRAAFEDAYMPIEQLGFECTAADFEGTK